MSFLKEKVEKENSNSQVNKGMFKSYFNGQKKKINQNPLLKTKTLFKESRFIVDDYN